MLFQFMHNAQMLMPCTAFVALCPFCHCSCRFYCIQISIQVATSRVTHVLRFNLHRISTRCGQSVHMKMLSSRLQYLFDVVPNSTQAKVLFIEQARDLREVRQKLEAVSLVELASICFKGTQMVRKMAGCVSRMVTCVAAEATAWGRGVLCIWQRQDPAVWDDQHQAPQHKCSARICGSAHLTILLPTREDVAAKLGDERCQGASGWKSAGDAMIEHAIAVAKLAQQFGAVFGLAGICRHSQSLEAGRHTTPHCRVKGCVSSGAAAALCRLLAELGGVAAASPPGLTGMEGAEAESRWLCNKLRQVVSEMLQARYSFLQL